MKTQKQIEAALEVLTAMFAVCETRSEMIGTAAEMTSLRWVLEIPEEDVRDFDESIAIGVSGLDQIKSRKQEG